MFLCSLGAEFLGVRKVEWETVDGVIGVWYISGNSGETGNDVDIDMGMYADTGLNHSTRR